ncbi:MAG: FAD:protein FMN transferase [Halioglobus sp.]
MQLIEHSFKAMGGPCRLRLEVADGQDPSVLISVAENEVRRLERKYSRYTDDSLTTKINEAAGTGTAVPIDPETAGLLRYADTLWRESDGRFDLTSGVLRRAWNFKSGVLPSQSTLDQLLLLVGWRQVEWSESHIALPSAGMEIDFGGCVKEYAADSAAAQLREHGAQAALVDLAGDMVAVGTPASAKGWPVGIRHPAQKDKAAAWVTLPEGGLASSGDYERCMVVQGKRYGHILDPTTGWPVEGLIAASVLAPQCLVAGSSATIAMLHESAAGLAWLSDLGLPWFAIDADFQFHGTLVGD